MSPLIALVLGANKRAKLSPSELELGALNSKITFGSGASFYGTCGGVGSTVKFFTPTTVANHGPDKDLTLRARLGNVAHDCEAFGTLARPCVATADPDHPPLFYGELSSNGSATSRLGPFKANASSRMDATGLSTITFTYLDVPVPWSTFIGVTSHQYGPMATYPLELTIKWYAPSSASDTFAANALTLPFSGLYGADTIHVHAAAGPSPPPPTSPPPLPPSPSPPPPAAPPPSLTTSVFTPIAPAVLCNHLGQLGAQRHLRDDDA